MRNFFALPVLSLKRAKCGRPWHYKTYVIMRALDSKLPYTTAQQTNPQRAGTPGRALRNRRAVVEIRRPLCLFLLLLASAPAHAQHASSGKPSLQLRVGAFMASALVRDFVTGSPGPDSISASPSNEIEIKQKPGPIASVSLLFPLRGSTRFEVGAAAASSKLKGDDGRQTWSVGNSLAGNLVVGFGHTYRGLADLHLGVGVTRLFVENRGMFSNGNSARALFEAGVSTALRGIDFDLRAQMHKYGTATLRENGGSDGRVLRIVLQAGRTLWRAHE